MRHHGLTASLFLMISACGGNGDVPPGAVDAGGADAGIDFVAEGVETFAPERVVAGEPFSISCLLIDSTGEMRTPPEGSVQTLRVEPDGSVERLDATTFTATRSGHVEVGCAFITLGLTDDTPSLIAVDPGPVAHVEAVLDRDALTAGESVEVSCIGVDAYGNAVEEVPATLRSDPMSEGNAFEGDVGTFERAGRYDVHCTVDGAESEPARLEVVPALPASLVIALVPDLPVYAIGQVIELARVVTDRYGNTIEDAVVSVTSTPPAGAMIGEGRFRYAVDGRYTLTATVSPPTEGDVVLRESVEIRVDSTGPSIRCNTPSHGGILHLTPGSRTTFSGSVSDLGGIASVHVNDTEVAVDAAGAFSTSLTTVFGVNFVDIAAVDDTGQETTRTCAFLVANRWAPDSSAFGDGLSLRLAQSAVDDGTRTGAINSLGDILHTVLNSAGLRDTLHASLLDANPLKPSSCDASVFGLCVFRSRVDYLDSELRGPNTTRLDLVNGGIRAEVELTNVRAQLRISGTLSSTGWVTFSSIRVVAIFDTRLSGGRLRVSVRPGSVTTTVGSISTSFSGLTGVIVDIVAALANGTLRNLVSNLVTGWVTDNFGSVLDGVVGSLDVASLGTSFAVPRLDGTGTIPVSFSPGFTSLTTSSSRMLVGLGVRIHTPAAHARPTRGAPIPTGTVRYDGSTTRPTQVAVHVGVLTQALHALWRGGFFDATLDHTRVSGLPSGVSAQLSTQLPPALTLRPDGRVELALGAMDLRLTYPELFATPLDAALGARASMRVRLVGDSFVFEDFRIDELHFSTDTVSLDGSTRTTLEGVLTRILERVMGDALNEALPAVPIPAFTLPASLGPYGLPVGAELGLTSPSLSSSGNHFLLSGSFGVR
jgi:hypothetical protein